MSKYQATVVEFPKTRLAGLKVRTSMAKAEVDCPAIWQAFGPQMGQFQNGDCQGSYGVSFMINAEDFDYWATAAVDPAAAVPAGFETCELPAGLYVKATAPNLEQLGPVFMYLYEEWAKGQTEYVPNCEAPGFEFYPANWDCSDSLEVYMPVRKA